MSRSRFLVVLVPVALFTAGCFPDSVSDLGPPAVVITSPTTATVSGNVNFKAEAVDDVGVTKVVFYVGTRTLGEVAAPPYEIRWNTQEDPDGPIQIRAEAHDAAGNRGQTSRSVTVNNTPG